jgi:formylmethanofuran:tetrahydromethanopterin formyltransferase
MMEGFGEIITLEETAKYSKIGKSTHHKMAEAIKRMVENFVCTTKVGDIMEFVYP